MTNVTAQLRVHCNTNNKIEKEVLKWQQSILPN